MSLFNFLASWNAETRVAANFSRRGFSAANNLITTTVMLFFLQSTTNPCDPGTCLPWTILRVLRKSWPHVASDFSWHNCCAEMSSRPGNLAMQLIREMAWTWTWFVEMPEQKLVCLHKSHRSRNYLGQHHQSLWRRSQTITRPRGIADRSIPQFPFWNQSKVMSL